MTNNQLPTDFLRHAKTYCALIEKIEQFSRLDSLAAIRRQLPILYAGAVDLPFPEPHERTGAERTVSHDEWQGIFDRIGSHIGRADLYWEVYDSTTEEPTEPIAFSLSDDLADIWRDLTNGLRHCRENATIVTNEAIWDWRFHFDAHWSQHVVDAMRAINFLFTTGPYNPDHAEPCDQPKSR